MRDRAASTVSVWLLRLTALRVQLTRCQLPLDQRRTGTRREGVKFGLFVFVQQTAFATGGFVLGMLLALTGAGGGGHGPGRVTGVLICFTFAAAALYGLAFLAVLGYRLTPEERVVQGKQ